MGKATSPSLGLVRPKPGPLRRALKDLNRLELIEGLIWPSIIFGARMKSTNHGDISYASFISYARQRLLESLMRFRCLPAYSCNLHIPPTLEFFSGNYEKKLISLHIPSHIIK